ncbi:fibronectin type III-like domain-contianing protein [Companilactobacillus bobalius]|uniref:fibronectin type III-like domain-contianing protein n=1 Tax=Companilactobacillus bobalius TaxID=2801451 RepID=UPI00118EADDA|nr:fibronectin type III-like domain-contianing protein [Companilactobacillus bobalius]GEO59081.1 hypothetical protein LBO01_22100 [Companilactobacillus paralimentarius]
MKSFKRVSLKAKEQKNVSFDITSDMLKFYGTNNKLTLEPGEFNVFVGPNSDTDQYDSFELK